MPDYEGIGALLATHEAITLYLRRSTRRRAARAPARSWPPRRWARTRPPARRSARCARTCRPHRRRAAEIVQGVEMGRPERPRAAIEGDRVRVGGDAVILAEGIVHLDA